MKKINADLSKMKVALSKYYKELSFEEETFSKELKELKKMLSNIKLIEKKLVESFSEIPEKLIDTKSLNSLTTKIQKTLPDFFPITKSIMDGCSLTIMNYGSVTLEGESIIDSSIQMFALNSDSVEHIKVPKNSTGTISLISNWFYKQELPKDVFTFRVFKGVETSNKVYSIVHTFNTDKDGKIQIYRKSVTKEIDLINNAPDSLFLIKDLDLSIDANNVFSFTGGLSENKGGNWDDAVKYYIKDQLENKKDFDSSFSLSLELKEDNNQKITPKLKELVFEKENQAILSSDQKNICFEWWQKLNPKLKNDVRNRKAKIVIQGFASPPGSDEYNNELGLDRARNVAKLLKPKIGTDINGEPLCIFQLLGEGEQTDDPRRYVRISILEI